MNPICDFIVTITFDIHRNVNGTKEKIQSCTKTLMVIMQKLFHMKGGFTKRGGILVEM